MKPPQRLQEVHRDEDGHDGASLVANRVDPEAEAGGDGGAEHDDVVDGTRQRKLLVYLSENAITVSRICLGCTYALVLWQGYSVISHLIDESAERHVFGWAVAGLFVCLAVPLSLHDIHMHILHYVSPLQKYYIRILWMVPIYAIESWLALRFKEQKAILETAREAYEAWVIYSFYKLMLTFIGETHEVAQQTIDALGREHAHMMFPLCRVEPWRLRGGQFLRITSFGVFQYVWIRLFFAVVGMIAELNGTDGDGEFNVNKLYIYEVVCVNVSQSWALYCLLIFYHEMIEPLADIKPFNKFVAIKCVIFLSFWQSVLISILSHYEYIEATMDYTEEDVSKGLQDFLICIEMAIAATLHRYCFSYRDFRPGGPLMSHLERVGSKRSAQQAIVEMLPIEVVNEVGGAINSAISSRLGPVRSRIEQTIRAGEAQWGQGGEADKGKGGEEQGKGNNVVERPGGEVVVDGGEEGAGGGSEAREKDLRVVMPEQGGVGEGGEAKTVEVGGGGGVHVGERGGVDRVAGEWEDSVELTEEARAPVTRKG